MVLKHNKLARVTPLLVHLSIGALLGGAFFHLLPETLEHYSDARKGLALVVIGIILFYVLELFLYKVLTKLPHRFAVVKPYGYINLVADLLHNFLDGILIASAYMTNAELGIAATLAVALHEIPQEIGDFGVLIASGFKRKQALWFNFLSALSAVLGALVILLIGSSKIHLTGYIIALAAGGFLYISMVDLIPELKNNPVSRKTIPQFITMLLSTAVLYALTFME
jgi:zinc and cadmium transporter